MELPWTCIGTLETSSANIFLMDDCKQGKMEKQTLIRDY